MGCVPRIVEAKLFHRRCPPIVEEIERERLSGKLLTDTAFWTTPRLLRRTIRRLARSVVLYESCDFNGSDLFVHRSLRRWPNSGPYADYVST